MITFGEGFGSGYKLDRLPGIACNTYPELDRKHPRTWRIGCSPGPRRDGGSPRWERDPRRQKRRRPGRKKEAGEEQGQTSTQLSSSWVPPYWRRRGPWTHPNTPRHDACTRPGERRTKRRTKGWRVEPGAHDLMRRPRPLWSDGGAGTSGAGTATTGAATTEAAATRISLTSESSTAAVAARARRERRGAATNPSVFILENLLSHLQSFRATHRER